MRFNSEGWDTLEDLEGGVDPRWTSASSVYYEEEPPRPPLVMGGPRELPVVGRRLPQWAGGRELPLPVVRKELWEAERQESQDSQTKDSGIDSGTSSNFNSSEDSSKGEVPRVYRVRIPCRLVPLTQSNAVMTPWCTCRVAVSQVRQPSAGLQPVRVAPRCSGGNGSECCWSRARAGHGICSCL